MHLPRSRHRLLPLTIASAFFLTTACGSAANDQDNGAGETEAPTAVQHKFGSTEVPADPQRIVALGYTELDFVLALGASPVAARYPQFGDTASAVRPWAEQAAGDAEPQVLTYEFGALNYEEIAALEPDLVLAVTAGITRQEYDTLSGIAPTVAQTDEFVDFGMPWQEITELIGEALGEPDRAREVVSDVEEQFAAARRANPEFDGLTVASAFYGEAEVLFFAPEDLRGRFFTSLGMQIPGELAEIAGDSFFGKLSLEQLDLIDRDVLVWSQLQFTEGGQAAIEADPVVQQLAATREGRALYVGGEVDDALQVSSVLSLPTALEGIVPMLERAVDGDPATRP